MVTSLEFTREPQMPSPADSAIGFEAVKVSMSQTKDGIKIVLVIHPNDNTQDLFNHPVGSRYQVALVQVDDEDKPLKPKSKTEGEHAVTSAALMCKDVDFQRWTYRVGHSYSPDEAGAVDAVQRYCGIASRAELGTLVSARRRYNDLILEFQKR